MAHEVETMAYANALPWHGLGNRVDQCISTDEMLVASGLDWEVEMHPLKVFIDDQIIRVPNKYALMRKTDNKVLTCASGQWHPLQNKDMLGFMDNYVKAGGATLETAGSLRNGKVVWGLAKLNRSFDVTRGDTVQGYLLFTSPHEVGTTISIRTTTVRVVCANTMAMAMNRGSDNYKQNHMSEFDVASAKESVEAAHEQLALAEKRAKTINGLNISLVDAVKLVLAPALGFDTEELTEAQMMDVNVQPKSLRDIITSINSAPGAISNNGWGVLNGATHWADHVSGREISTRMFRSWVGDNANLKLDIERRLLELAE